VTAFDSAGGVVFSSGDLDESGDLRDRHSSAVQAGTVEVDTQLSNFQSKNITLAANYSEEGQYTREIVESDEAMFPFEANYIEKHSLEPLEVRSLSYRFACGPGCARVEVALQYRNLPPYVLRALGLSELVPRLQVFTLDTVKLEL
jgi:hypothetical protein